MGSINKQILLGRLTADAESRAMANGDPVISLRIETFDRYKDRASGEWKDISEFHRVIVFSRLAEEARELKKGTEVYIEGRTRTRKYNQHGQDRYITEVAADVLIRTGEEAKVRADTPRPTAKPAASPASTSESLPLASPERPSNDGDANQAPF